MTPAAAPASGRAPALEIAVASPTGAAVAAEGGADRVELCSGLELGGLTPSQGLIESVVAGPLPAHVLIRPRPGDFVFSGDDVVLMEQETRAAARSGAAGVVIGALDASGDLDTATLERLIAAARGIRDDITIVVHRAIDQSADPAAAAAACADLGIDRILTSGGASRARDGSATLARMVAVAGPVQIMAGGGVRVDDIAGLVALGVDAVHLSAKRPVARSGSGWVSLGSSADGPESHFETDVAVVRAARAAL